MKTTIKELNFEMNAHVRLDLIEKILLTGGWIQDTVKNDEWIAPEQVLQRMITVHRMPWPRVKASGGKFPLHYALAIQAEFDQAFVHQQMSAPAAGNA